MRDVRNTHFRFMRLPTLWSRPFRRRSPADDGSSPSWVIPTCRPLPPSPASKPPEPVRGPTARLSAASAIPKDGGESRHLRRCPRRSAPWTRPLFRLVLCALRHFHEKVSRRIGKPAASDHTNLHGDRAGVDQSGCDRPLAVTLICSALCGSPRPEESRRDTRTSRTGSEAARRCGARSGQRWGRTQFRVIDTSSWRVVRRRRPRSCSLAAWRSEPVAVPSPAGRS